MTSKRILTKADADFLERQFSKVFATKKDLEDQEQKFEKVVTDFKDKFYTKIDPILKEVVASREDRTIGAEQHRRNQDRIEKLEKIHNIVNP